MKLFFVCLLMLTVLYTVSSFHSTIGYHHSVNKRVLAIPQQQHHNRRILLRTKRGVKAVNVTIPNAQQKANRIELESERRILQRKRKRLRQLRNEVRELSDQLHAKRFLKDDVLINRAQRRREKESQANWRRLMSSRIKAIMKRLKKIEAGLKLEKSKTKNKDKKRMLKQEKIRGMLRTAIATATLTTTTPRITTVANAKIRRLHSLINQSKNGESGSVCHTHKDCKPGLCCHLTSLNGTKQKVCFQHSRLEGEKCEDTCQCEARLHCFSNSSIRPTGTNHSGTTTVENAICKKVSIEDVTNGIYLNAKDSSFMGNPKRKKKR